MNWGEYIVITDINTKYRICWGPISPIWEKTWSILSFCFILAIWDRRFWVKKLSIVFSRPRSSFASVTSMFQKSKHNRYLSHFAATCKTNCLFFQSFTGLVHEYNVLDLVRINVEQTYIVKYHESRCLSHFFLVCKTSCFKVNSAKVAWEAVNLWHFTDTYWDQSYILESVVSIRK